MTNGVIEEINFVGAYERLMLRLDLVARQAMEGAPPLYTITITTPEKKPASPSWPPAPSPKLRPRP